MLQVTTTCVHGPRPMEHMLHRYPAFKFHKSPLFKFHRYPLFKFHWYPLFKFHKYPLFRFHRYPLFKFHRYSLFKFHRYPLFKFHRYLIGRCSDRILFPPNTLDACKDGSFGTRPRHVPLHACPRVLCKHTMLQLHQGRRRSGCSPPPPPPMDPPLPLPGTMYHPPPPRAV